MFRSQWAAALFLLPNAAVGHWGIYYHSSFALKVLPGFKVVAAAILPAAAAHMVGQLTAGCYVDIPHKGFGAMVALRAIIA